MPTSKLDRLNKLFEGDKRIAQADPTKPHIADLDFMPKISTTKQAIPDPELAEEPQMMPKVVQYQRSIPLSPPSAGRDLELLTSSDDDEYLAAFSSKPAAKQPAIKAQPSGKASTVGYGAGPPRRGNLAESANEISDHDVDGNPLTGRFCPLALVAKFPYKYMVDTNDRVSRQFFAQNKFYQRKWDIYYVDPPRAMMVKAIVLLPLGQVEHLIDQINTAFKTNIECPPDPFIVSFFDDGMPQPKHLGVSRSREDLADMQASIPTAPDDYTNYPASSPQEGAATSSSSGLATPSIESGGRSAITPRKPTERSFADFKAKMERILASAKKDKEAAKKKKTDDRFLKQQDSAKQLKRAQRYLGLRPKATKMPFPDATCSWAEQQTQQKQDLRACGILLDPLDTSKSAPYAFESDSVIVCVDVEAYERDHRKITEIGVSTLDTLDLAGIPPGGGGEDWIAQIRSRHFRIRGRAHLENKDFCPGDANNFQFGNSEWVSLDAAAEIVDRCFEYPFSIWFKPKNLTHEGSPTGETEPATQLGPRKRNVIFLGHDISNEIKYLRHLGSHIFSQSRATSATEVNAQERPGSETLASIIEALDTTTLYKVLVRDTQTQSLGRMMVGLGRTAWHLHNAGNDARYTLEALIALLIKARTMEDEATHPTGTSTESENRAHTDGTAASWTDEVERRVKEKTSSVERGVREDSMSLEKALHTMTIAGTSGQQVEVKDPWLVTQESDQEVSQPAAGTGDEDGKLFDGGDVTTTAIHGGSSASGAHYPVSSSADAVDGGDAEVGGLAKLVKEGAGGKKKVRRIPGQSADGGLSHGRW